MGKAENVSIFFIHNTHLYTLKPPCQENPFVVIRNWKKMHCKLLGFGPFGPLRLDIDFLRPDIDILRPDIDILRPDINILRPDIDILRPKI